MVVHVVCNFGIFIIYVFFFRYKRVGKLVPYSEVAHYRYRCSIVHGLLLLDY